MRLVVLESPYAAPTEPGIASNVAYAQACMRDCLARGDSPMVSHILWAHSGALDDACPAQRAQGIDAGLAWLRVAQASVVYVDRGISRGMKLGIEAAQRAGVPVEYRSLLDRSPHSPTRIEGGAQP